MRQLSWLCLFAGAVGCSSLLEYDALDFDPDASDIHSDARPDGASGQESGSAGSGGSNGATGGTGGSNASGGNVSDASDETIDSAADSNSNPCEGVECSVAGTCVVKGGQASCDCQTGYHAEGLTCMVDETCTGVECGRCGTCEILEGKATCTCPKDMKHDGKGCVPDPNPCDTMDCGSDAVCVPEAHCHPLGYCAPKCDCSNCGNCGSSSDGRWNDLQEYCGAQPDESPAQEVCNKPCPSGEGCLPYATPFCWGGQGCFSL